MYPSRSAASASCPRPPAQSSRPASAARSLDNQSPPKSPSHDRTTVARGDRNLHPQSEIRAASLRRFPAAAHPPKCFAPPPSDRRQISAASSRNSTSPVPDHAAAGPHVKATVPPPALRSTPPILHPSLRSPSPAPARRLP